MAIGIKEKRPLLYRCGLIRVLLAGFSQAGQRDVYARARNSAFSSAPFAVGMRQRLR
jgi:hypothetical protein